MSGVNRVSQTIRTIYLGQASHAKFQLSITYSNCCRNIKWAQIVDPFPSWVLKPKSLSGRPMSSPSWALVRPCGWGGETWSTVAVVHSRVIKGVKQAPGLAAKVDLWPSASTFKGGLLSLGSDSLISVCHSIKNLTETPSKPRWLSSDQ